jgi:hypothetical protein
MKTKQILDEEIKNVFEELLSHSVLNVNIMYQNIENSNLLQAVTWFPFEMENCGNEVINIRVIDECESFENPDTEETDINWQEYYLDLFPKFPKTYHNCPLKITANINEPYVVSNNNVNETIKKGLEILMLNTIAEKLKLTLVYKIVEREQAFKLITDNPENGFYADLIQRYSATLLVSNSSESK